MENQSFFKRNQTVFLAIIVFFAISYIYFSPILEGKVIKQSDVENLKGGFTEIRHYKETTGNYALWSNSMFCGMPTYLMWLGYPSNIAGKLIDWYNLILPNPINTIFLYLVGFFILLRTLKMNVWLSVMGAVAFTFSSYNFAIIAAGHTNKAIVIGLFAPTIAGIIMAYRNELLKGASVTALALALQIRSNHYQMSYYLAMAIGIYVIVQFIYAIKDKTIANFFKSSAVLVGAAALAIAVNITPLLLTEEYAKESIRGKSELTLDPKASKDGLSEEYAFEYSYGVGESFTLLIPNFNGGASAGALSKNSETYKFLKERNVPNAPQIIKQLPLYWGDQAFTAGPIYFGAIVLFLFILGFFIVQRKEKWWILATVVLTLALSWGKNFLFLSDFFFNHFPYYNKFRAVSSILTVTSLLVPLMAAFAVEEIINTKENSKVLLKKVRNAFFVVGGLALLFAVMPGLAGSFINETRDKASFGESYEQLISAISADRESLLRMDALRSFAFILIGAGLLYAFISKKIKSNYLLIGLALTITIDMWAVDKRYLNNDNFGKKVKNLDTEVPPNAVDLEILKDPAMYYRVYNLTVNPFTDGNTSRYHKSIGGYHAAKLKRYQELIENQISKGNMNVLSMLNTKYFITAPQGSNQAIPQTNPMACGNAWFINDIKYVANADSEMLALTNFDPKQTVFIDQRFKERVGAMNLKKDSTANIALTYYSPDTLNYTSNTAAESFAVFSEIYYEKGWNAYLDGQKTDHIRVNYLLRGMKIPAGKHEVSFRFEPANYFLGEKIAGVSSILLVLLVAGNLLMAWRKNKALARTN
jgi:hypothetical protein